MQKYDIVLLHFRSTRVEFRNATITVVDNSEIQAKNDMTVSSSDGTNAEIYGDEIIYADEINRAKNHPVWGEKSVFSIGLKEVRD